MKRRDFLTLMPLAAGALSWGCRRKLRPELIKIEDFEDRKGGWRIIKVACVGDSITHGAGVEDREKNNYPKQLGELLGNRFEVRNFGRSGATLSRVGDLPYANTDEFKAENEISNVSSLRICCLYYSTSFSSFLIDNGKTKIFSNISGRSIQQFSNIIFSNIFNRCLF